MTGAEETRLFIDHCARAGDFLVDRLLCIRAFANRAHARGNRFVYSQGAIS